MRLELTRVGSDNELQERMVRFFAKMEGPEFFLIPQRSANYVTASCDVIDLGDYVPLSVDYLALGPIPGVYRVRGKFTGYTGFAFTVDIREGTR